MTFIVNAESRSAASARPLPAVTPHLMSDLFPYISGRPVSGCRRGIAGLIPLLEPLRRDVNPTNAIVARMHRGPALVYLDSVTHCGGAYRANAPRTGLIRSCCLGWLQQYENAFLAYLPHVASRLARHVRDLLG